MDLARVQIGDAVVGVVRLDDQLAGAALGERSRSGNHAGSEPEPVHRGVESAAVGAEGDGTVESAAAHASSGVAEGAAVEHEIGAGAETGVVAVAGQHAHAEHAAIHGGGRSAVAVGSG